jgi:hypothetical protein
MPPRDKSQLSARRDTVRGGIKTGTPPWGLTAIGAGVAPAERCPMCKAIRWAINLVPVLLVVVNGHKWIGII